LYFSNLSRSLDLFVVKWIKDYPTNFQIQSKNNQFCI